MRKLKMRQLAADNRSHYREHDPDRSRAHETALDHVRDGTGISRAFRADGLGVHLTSVAIPGRPNMEDVIAWQVLPDTSVAILYLGPLEDLS